MKKNEFENSFFKGICRKILLIVNLVLIFSMTCFVQVYASDYSETQQKVVTGKVTDPTGQPMPGVAVLVKGTTLGTVTNSDGNYTLDNVPTGSTLEFSFFKISITHSQAKRAPSLE